MKEHVDKIKEGVAGAVEEATRDIRRKVYKAVEHAEEDAREGRGVPGAAKGVYDRAKELHNRVQQEGGNRAKAKGAISHAAEKVDGAVESIGQRVEAAFDAMEQTGERLSQSIENRFYTDGEFDEKKADAYLRSQGEALKRASERALAAAGGLVDKVREDYRRFIPTAEENAGIYAGIGIKLSNQQPLFREDKDACLAFYERARTTLPSGLRWKRAEILKDIKDYAVGGLPQLVYLYNSQKTPTGKVKARAQAKLEVLGRYEL